MDDGGQMILKWGGTNMLVEWSLEIAGAAYPTLAWTNPADIVYGTALSGRQLNATAVYNSTTVSGTFTYTPAAGTVLNAGLGQTLSVTFTPSNMPGFLPISTNVAVSVLKAPLMITANSTNKVYGAALPALMASYRGWVNSDTPASLSTRLMMPVCLQSGGSRPSAWLIRWIAGSRECPMAAMLMKFN